MTPRELLALARSRGIHLEPDGGTLVVRGPQRSVAELRGEIFRHKWALIALLQLEDPQPDADLRSAKSRGFLVIRGSKRCRELREAWHRNRQDAGLPTAVATLEAKYATIRVDFNTCPQQRRIREAFVDPAARGLFGLSCSTPSSPGYIAAGRRWEVSRVPIANVHSAMRAVIAIAGEFGEENERGER